MRTTISFWIHWVWSAFWTMPEFLGNNWVGAIFAGLCVFFYKRKEFYKSPLVNAATPTQKLRLVRDFLVVHWKATLKLWAVVLVSFFVGHILDLVRANDEWLSTHNAGQANMIIRDVSTLNECKATITARDATVQDKQSLADTFQKAFTSVQGPQAQISANLASCMAKMNSKIVEEVSVIQVPFATQDIKGRVDPGRVIIQKHIIELFVLTNILEPHFHGILKCSKQFTIQVAPQIMTESNVIMSGGNLAKPLTDYSYELRVDQTPMEWNPSHPAFVRVLSNDADLGKCEFTLL
jgi:hypothetical protein